MPRPDPATASIDRPTLLALLEASRAVNEHVNLAEVFQQVTSSAAAVLRAEAASLLLLDSARGELVFEAATGPAGERLHNRRMPAGEGIAGQAVQSGHVVRVDDVRQSRTFYQEIDQETAMRTRGLIAAPLIDRDETLGVIEVLNPRERDCFTDQDAKVLEIFANLVAAAMRNAQKIDRVSRENRALRDSARGVAPVGRSKTFADALELCRRVAPANTSVLLLGETGTGKEVSARLIHEVSNRRDKPFIAVNCAALPETLLESELFGHEKGAFTGADRERQGWFELADGGTLFLDEIGEIPPSTQAKLLRVIQEREFVRVGGSKPISCDTRVITATNRDLKEACEEGEFRDDLYYRLSVFPIRMPPLRERSEDIPLLVEHFIGEIAPQIGAPAPTIEADAMSALIRYDWPGNIRELRNVLERCTLLAADGRITVDLLPEEVRVATAGADQGAASMTSMSSSSSAAGPEIGQSASALAQHEKALILQALHESDWNQSAAARKLGVTRDVLRYRLKKYGIEPPPGT